MPLGRRGLVGGVALAVAALPGVAAAAPSRAPNVVVYCDRALRRAMTELGRRFAATGGAPVNVFCAVPRLMLAQIERITQNDVLITGAATMDQAAARRLIRPETRIALGANRLVLAAKRAATKATDPGTIGRLIGLGPLAAPDPTAGTTINAAAALAAIGLRPPLPFPLIGAIDTEDVAGLIHDGTARLGLMHRTEAAPDSGLAVAAVLPESPSEPYAAAISVVTRSPRAVSFMEFLQSPTTRDALAAAGLEMAA